MPASPFVLSILQSFRLHRFLFNLYQGLTLIQSCFIPQGHTKLPDYVPVGQFPKPALRDLFTAATADALNLLSRCLIFEPRKRISAKDVCTTNCFRNLIAYPSPLLVQSSGSSSSIFLRPSLPDSPFQASQNKFPARTTSTRRSRRQCRSRCSGPCCQGSPTDEQIETQSLLIGCRSPICRSKTRFL